MVQYDYTSSGGFPSLQYIHEKVALSDMTSKSIEYCSFHQDSSALSVFFTDTLNESDQTALNGIVSDSTVSSTTESFFNGLEKPSKKYKVTEYDTSNKFEIESWYEDDDGDGTYSILAEKSVYNYQGSNLLSILTTNYLRNGSIDSTSRVEYFRNEKKFIEKYQGV